jgi:hypothetical protein
MINDRDKVTYHLLTHVLSVPRMQAEIKVHELDSHVWCQVWEQTWDEVRICCPSRLDIRDAFLDEVYLINK